MHACVGADRTTAHQAKNSHPRLGLRSLTAHHASPGMFWTACVVGRGICVSSAVGDTARTPLSIVVYLVPLQQEKLLP
jgi:hypothetical protein